MRVVVLGAGGAMGRVAARQLAANGTISELVLADLDAAVVDQQIREIGDSPRLRSAACDVLDPSQIRQLLGAADLVVNCAGPFFRLGLPTLRAAIETATTYLDICDDPEPTIEMLELDDHAREAGVVAVVGMGASPGVSNLLAARAARRLDTVHDCITGWSLDDASDDEPVDRASLAGADGSPAGAVVHFMEQIHGVVPVVDDGVLVRRAPLEAIELEYPNLGRGTGYVVGHPEPVTLHLSLGVTGRSCNVVLVRDGATAAFLRGLQRDLDAGELDLDAAARVLLSPGATRLAKAAAGGLRLRGSGSLPPLFAWVRGTIDGREAVAGCHVTSLPRGMALATSIPAALAANQILATPPKPGVHAPEAVIDADRLFADLLPFCATTMSSVDDLAPVHVELVR